MNLARVIARSLPFLYVASFATASGLLYLVVNTSDHRKVRKQSVAQVVRLAQSKFPDIHVEATSIPIKGAKPLSSFLLTLDKRYEKECFFPVGEYWVITGGDPLRNPFSSVGKQISNHQSPSSFEDAVRNIGLKEVDLKIAKLDPAKFCRWAQEQLRAAGRFILQNGPPKVDVYIKGYADRAFANPRMVGQKSWVKKFHPDYDTQKYHSFEVMNSISKDRNNGFLYGGPPQLHTIGATYGNADLPDLRAIFVGQSLVSDDAQDFGGKEIYFHILEGYEFNETSDPALRKVQVYISYRDE